MYKITFYPENKTVEVSEDTSLLEAAEKAGIRIINSCGGNGSCGKCRVRIISGKIFSSGAGTLSKDETAEGFVLSCLSYPAADISLEVPGLSRLNTKISVKPIITEIRHKTSRPFVIKKVIPYEPSAGPVIPVCPALQKRGCAGIYDEKQLTVSYYHTPAGYRITDIFPGRKDRGIYLELPKPTTVNNTADLERLTDVLAAELKKTNGLDKTPAVTLSLSLFRKLPGLLRTSDFKVTAPAIPAESGTVTIREEQGDTVLRNFGLAIDIGTTTLEIHLVDLLSGRDFINLRRVRMNPQGAYGDDVITRIVYSETENHLAELQTKVISEINAMIEEILSSSGEILSGFAREDITTVMVCGNTVMTQLFFAVNPAYIRRSPYVPAAHSMPLVAASELGLKLNPAVPVLSMPSPACYVGGDVVAGVIASGMDRAENKNLVLIDLGTNGEVVVKEKKTGALLCCATSAGPCFEGGGISCGMKAFPGAIEKVGIDDSGKAIVSVIGPGCKPIGLCGSGILSLLGELIRKKKIDRSGRMTGIPESERERKFLVVPAGESASNSAIYISESDIKNLLNSKAAIYAGLMTVLKKLEIQPGDIDRIFISGGLGNSLDFEAVTLLGLLPDIGYGKYEFIGNSAITGCAMCLSDMTLYEKSKEISSSIMYLDLSGEPSYMDEFTAGLFFPHTDINLFPSVRKFY